PEQKKANERVDIGTAAPISETIKTGEPVWLESRASLPLAAGGRVLGALSLTFANAREAEEQDRSFLMSVAHQCAQALDRARLYRDEQRARSRSEFLAKASAALAESLDYEQTLQSVARLAVPQFADWSAGDLIADDKSVRRVAVAHIDPAKVELGWELSQKFPPRHDDTYGVAHVLRTGIPEFLEHIPDSLLVEVISDPDLLEVVRALKLSSSIIVPIKTKGRALAAIT